MRLTQCRGRMRRLLVSVTRSPGHATAPPTPLLCLLLSFSFAWSPGSWADGKDWQDRVSPRLLGIIATRADGGASAGSTAESARGTAANSNHGVRFDADGRLQIDVIVDCGAPSPTAALTAAGMKIGTTVMVRPLCVVEGWASAGDIPALAVLAGVTRVDLPRYARHHPPLRRQSNDSGVIVGHPLATGASSIDGNGIGIMNTTQFITQAGVNGSGAAVAIMSDDVHSLSVIQGRGELPATVNVVKPSSNPAPHTTYTDEGTMMLEEVYAVAPGANLAFCGPETFTEYVGCLQNLIAAGSSVIADDIAYFGVDVFTAPSANVDSASIESLLTANPNVMLFHSVGNDNQDYWQGSYAPAALTQSLTCSGGGSSQTDAYYQPFSGSTTYLSWFTLGGNDLYLASALPNGQSTPNPFDVYIFKANGSNPLQQVTCATANNRQTEGGTSYTVLDGSSLSVGTYYIVIASPTRAPSGTYLKLIGMGDGGDTFATVTTGAPTSPQDFAAGVITVGAVDGADGVGNTIEAFSDVGPIQVELPTPSTLQAPVLVAPDGIVVDNAGTSFGSSTFYGTSAASPNAASVTALLRSAFPSLAPTAVLAALESGADMPPGGGAAPNGTFGYGRVDAVGALNQLSAPSISSIANQTVINGSSSGPLSFTLHGAGTLTVGSSSDNTALLPAGGSAITVAPAGCGSSTLSCSVTVTPALGQVGVAHVTLTTTDSLSRTASTTFTVTVTKPAPPTINFTSGTNQTATGGGVTTTLAPIAFALTGSQTLQLSVMSSNTALLPVSGIVLTNGCGTTVFGCSANLTVQAGQLGLTTITILATDAFAQSASASTVLTIGKPAAPTVSIASGGSQTVTGAGATTPTAPLAFTLQGASGLTVNATSSNTALVANSAITFAAGCGSASLTCDAALVVSANQSGSTTVTITATDAYGQSGTATTTLKVNKPAPPTVTVGSGATQTINEGGTLSAIGFTLTGTQALNVSTTSSNPSLLPASNILVSSGCGSTNLNCTGSLTAVAGQGGSSTITIVATDPYEQTGSATAVVNVNAPSHGGGAVDAATLVALASLLALRRRRPQRV